MTKVTLAYDLVHPLTDEDAEAVAKAHAVYGIARILVAPALNALTVDFDASRLSEKDVEAALIGVGVPLKREPVAVSQP